MSSRHHSVPQSSWALVRLKRTRMFAAAAAVAAVAAVAAALQLLT